MAKLVEANVLLYLRGMIVKDGGDYESWWPRTIIYAPRFAATDLWAGSEPLSFFNGWAPRVFGPITVNEFQTAVATMSDQFRGSYGFPGPNIAALTNLQHLGSRPYSPPSSPRVVRPASRASRRRDGNMARPHPGGTPIAVDASRRDLRHVSHHASGA